ncbi:17768_t:CDS:1, partial [Acaulospora morrowiae]
MFSTLKRTSSIKDFAFYSLPRATPYKISLVSLDWIRKKDPPIALGHACIKAALRQSFRQSQLMVNDHT